MAASHSRVPYDYLCKYHPKNDDWEMTKSQIELYEWLDEKCNAGHGDDYYPDSLERVKKDFEDLLPAFAYFLRQKSGEQQPFATDGITSLTIPGGWLWDSEGELYRSFFEIIQEGRIRMDMVANDFLVIFRRQQALYWLAVELVFTGPHHSSTRPQNPYVAANGHIILEPGISEAVLKTLLDITTNINEDPSMDETQKLDAWVTEMQRWQMSPDTEETQAMLPDVYDLHWVYFEAFEDYYRSMRSTTGIGRAPISTEPFALLDMIQLIESFYLCFKNGAGRRGADLVEFVIRQMEEQILHPANNRLINAFDLVIAYVKAKMEEIELLQRLEFLKHEPQRAGYGTNTEDIRELIWQQGRLSPSDWQRAFENLGLSDTFQKLTRILNKGPYYAVD